MTSSYLKGLPLVSWKCWWQNDVFLFHNWTKSTSVHAHVCTCMSTWEGETGRKGESRGRERFLEVITNGIATPSHSLKVTPFSEKSFSLLFSPSLIPYALPCYRKSLSDPLRTELKSSPSSGSLGRPVSPFSAFPAWNTWACTSSNTIWIVFWLFQGYQCPPPRTVTSPRAGLQPCCLRLLYILGTWAGCGRKRPPARRFSSPAAGQLQYRAGTSHPHLLCGGYI